MSRKSSMQVGGESDGCVVPMKCSNNGEEPSTESMEGRRPAKENIAQATAPRTQSRISELSDLSGVRKVAREEKRQEFTALLHHVTVGLLRDSYYALKRDAARGVDGLTWKEYETELEPRLAVLHSWAHLGTYRAQPSKRAYIPKADGRQRPLGIAALEDKIVQQALTAILNQIYEEDFMGSRMVPSGAKPASSAGCALGGDHAEEGELGARCRHSRVLRQHEPRMDDEVRRAPRCRPKGTTPDPKMAEGGSIRGRELVEDRDRDSAGSGDLAATGECLPALCFRLMGSALAKAPGDGRHGSCPVRR